jgi:hypothetical protein
MDDSLVIEVPHNPAAHKTANISFVLFIAGGVIGIYQMATTVIPFGEGFEMVALANNLAHSGTFANPFHVLETGPTAANPPLYPLLLAIIIRIFRVPAAILFIATLCNVFANALTASWLPRLSDLIYKDIRPGIVAAVLWLLSVQLMPSWDTSYTVATLLLFCQVTSSGIQQQNSARYGAVAGLIAGSLLLFNPSTTLIFLPWLSWLCFEHRANLKQAARYCGSLLAILLLVGFAWAFRNHQQLGKFLVRTNLGISLYASNSDCARSSLILEQLDNCYQARHPNTSIREAQLLMSLGEPAYDRMRVRDTEKWIETHPGPFASVTLARVRDFWFTPLYSGRLHSAVIWLATLFSLPGLLLMAFRRVRATLFVFVVLFVYPLMYYVVASDVRYRLPVLWLSLLPAGYLLTHVTRFMFHPSPKGPSSGHPEPASACSSRSGVRELSEKPLQILADDRNQRLRGKFDKGV